MLADNNAVSCAAIELVRELADIAPDNITSVDGVTLEVCEDADIVACRGVCNIEAALLVKLDAETVASKSMIAWAAIELVRDVGFIAAVKITLIDGVADEVKLVAAMLA